jgi:flagellar biosynthesis anti-sigma factor FlgM
MQDANNIYTFEIGPSQSRSLIMKIDPRVQFPGDIQPDAVKNSGKTSVHSTRAAGANGVKPAAGEDTVNISSTHGDLQTLKASFAHVPEVRTALVTALRQQVNTGQFQPDSLKVADAVIADHAGRHTAA